MKTNRILVTTSRGCEEALAGEIAELCEALSFPLVKPPRIQAAGVLLTGSDDLVAILNLGLTTASRVLLIVGEGEAHSEEDVYRVARDIDWPRIFNIQKTFAIRADCRDSFARNSMFVALKVKDAIADRFRQSTGERPSVNPSAPDVPITVRLVGREVSIAIDTSGEPLSEHGYRTQSGGAPLRENLAAALLRYAGWSSVARAIQSPDPEPAYLERAPVESKSPRRIPARVALPPVFLDPMCGTGTLGIEAALMLLNRKPNSRRRRFAFQSLLAFQGELAERRIKDLRQTFRERELTPGTVRTRLKIYAEKAGIELPGEGLRHPIVLSDQSRDAMAATRANAEEAVVDHLIEFGTRSFFNSEAPAGQGLLVCNPPYGERLGEAEAMNELYRKMGDHLKQNYAGWMAWMVSGNATALKSVGLRPTRKISLYNGELPCAFAQFILYAKNPQSPTTENREETN